MADEQSDASLDALLYSTHELHRLGLTARSIAERTADGELTRLRRGWYAETAALNTVSPPTRQLAAMRAAHQATPSGVLFGHRSAATAHDLPVWSDWLRATGGGAPLPSLEKQLITEQLVPPGFRAARSTFVRYRQGTVPDTDRCTVAGVPVTSVDRTLFDLARSEPFEVALACADQHLRRTFRAGPHVDIARWRDWQAMFRKRITQAAGVPGIRRVRALAALADPRADSPLESVSRLRLTQLGIDVEPQFAVRGERGGTYYTDFWFIDAPFFGECDGKHKYTDPALRGARSAEEVVVREKRRHDWITGSTGRRGVRWGAADAMSAATLSARLAAFGVPVPGTPSERTDPATATLLRRLR